MTQAVQDATMVALTLMASLVQGTAFQAPIGYRKDGTPIYPIGGGDGTSLSGLGEQVNEMTAKIKAALDVMEESKATDGARWAAANDERQAHAKALADLQEKIAVRERDEMTAKAVADTQAFLRSVRTPAKAIGGNMPYGRATQEDTAGQFLLGVFLSQSRDAEDQGRGKAMLADLQTRYQEAWGEGGSVHVPGGVLAAGKATVGSTDATGGWIIPNAPVESIIKTEAYKNPLRPLITPVTGVRSAAVDIPFRSSGPSRAVVAGFNTLKENRDLAYNGYSATMYTMALIYDLGKQFVRQSAGAAEQDVMQTLGEAFALGERYYIMSGSGSSEPYGLLTALTASPATYTTSHTPSATTLAGSVATAIAKCAGALATRNVDADRLTAVMSATDYWTMAAQGTDTAGFFYAPAGGPANIRPGTLMTPFGIPVLPDPAMTSDRLVVGDFKSLKVYYGDTYRVDSSDQAGTRWDYNLVGFRGEMEIGLDARPAVYSGHFQQVTDLIA